MSVRLEARPPGDAVVRRVDPRVPTALLVVAGVVLAVNVVVLFLGAWSIGVTTDEPIHVDRLQHWFDLGWYVPETQMDGVEPDQGLSGIYVYGPVAALVAHLVSVLGGTESWGSVSAAPEAYATRHLAVALFSILGLAAVAATTRLLLRSWRWALIAAAVLSAIPTWTGHGMFNIKDTPVAAGYTGRDAGARRPRPSVRAGVGTAAPARRGGARAGCHGAGGNASRHVGGAAARRGLHARAHLGRRPARTGPSARRPRPPPPCRRRCVRPRPRLARSDRHVPEGLRRPRTALRGLRRLGRLSVEGHDPHRGHHDVDAATPGVPAAVVRRPDAGGRPCPRARGRPQPGRPAAAAAAARGHGGRRRAR